MSGQGQGRTAVTPLCRRRALLLLLEHIVALTPARGNAVGLCRQKRGETALQGGLSWPYSAP